jgi:hypothetical protein
VSEAGGLICKMCTGMSAAFWVLKGHEYLICVIYEDSLQTQYCIDKIRIWVSF